MSKFNIVQFQAASGLPLTADFIIKTLGVEPDETVKRAMFWNRDKYGLIIGRLQNFINGKVAANPCDFDGSRPKKTEDDPFAEASPPAAQTAAAADDDPFGESTSAATEDEDDPFGESTTESADDLFA